jgi:hypothetical protein
MALPIPGEGLAGVKDGFDPLPAGTYDVVVTDAEETVTSGEGKTPAGTPMIKWEFEVQDEEYVGRKLWSNNVLTEKALPIFKGTLRGLGYTDAEMDVMTEFDPSECIGRTAKAVVSTGTNPKTKEANNSVKRLLPLSEEESELPG